MIKEMENKINITFKLVENNCHENITLLLPEATTILEVKDILANKLNFKNIELLFVGQLMSNEKQLKHYSVGLNTTVYVLNNDKLSHSQAFTGDMATLPNITYPYPYLVGMWMHHSAFNKSKSIFTNIFNVRKLQPKISRQISVPSCQFYVYCGSFCNAIVKGKLRVRCCKCKGKEIRLLQEPENWNDVSSSARCICYAEHCESDNHAEFYFQCGSKVCQDSNSNPIQCVKDNLFGKVCCICFDKKNPVLHFPCNDDHVLCVDCFTSYAREELLNRRLHFNDVTGCNVTCPAGCKNSKLSDPHVFYYLGTDEYKIFQEIAAETCVLRSMSGFICPNRLCGSGLFDDVRDLENKYCKCSVCGYEFCANCKEEYHGVSNCSQVTASESTENLTLSKYKMNVKTIQETTKPCPCCKIPTEKNGGCMHLTCFNCKYEWCWICNTSWNFDCQSDHWFA